MEVYRTEQEQIEAIKKFFHDYGNHLVAGILLFVLVFVGYHYWAGRQQAAAEKASLAYSELREILQAGTEVKGDELARFDGVYSTLMSDHADSIYASYASLLKAKLHVQSKEYDKASQALQWVVKAAATPEIVALANLRLARVAFAQGNHDKALEYLKNDAAPYASAYEELRGDIYLDTNQTDKALLAYKKALELSANSKGTADRILEMKVESLASDDAGKLVTLSVPNESQVSGNNQENTDKIKDTKAE